MMSNDADGGAPGGSVPIRSRRSWPRRVFRAFVALTLLPLLLVAVVVAVLHTPAGGTLVRRGLEGWGSRAVGGTLRIGELELRPLRGQVRLGAVSLIVPGVTLDAQRIEIDWSPRSGPHLRLLQPHVIARADAGRERDEAPAVGLAAQPWRALERLGSLEVRQGRLELRDEARAQQLVLGGVELEVPGAGERRGSLRIADASVSGPEGARGLPASIQGTFRLDGGALVIESARVSAGSSALDLHGRLERVLPTTATLAARATLDSGSLSALVPEADLEGQVAADTELQLTNDILSGLLRAESPALTAQRVGPWAVRTLAHFQGGKLVVESLTARGFGGVVELTGDVAIASPAAADLLVRASGVDPAALAKAVSGHSIPLAARVSGSLRLTTTDGLAAARGEGRFTLAPAAGPGLKPTGVASLRIQGSTLSLDASIEKLGARATAAVTLEGKGSLRGRWSADLDVASLPAIAAELGHAVETPAVLGRLRAEGELGGAIAEPEVTARVSSHRLSVRGTPFAFEAKARYERGRLSLAPLVLRAGGGQATLSGQVPLLPTEPWDLAGEIDALDLAPALALVGLDGDGPLGGKLQLQGPRDTPVGQASLNARVTLRRPVAATPAQGAAKNPAGSAESTVVVAVEARSRGRSIEVERVQAEAADGRAFGSGRYDAASEAMALTLTAQGLAWQRLPLLPEWAEALTGTLSGEVQLAGTTRAPTGHLRLGLDEPRVKETPLPPVSLEARFDGRELRVTGKGDAVFLRGHAALEGDWPLRLEIDLHALPLAPLLEALPAVREANATLDARGTIMVELPLREPSLLRYSSRDLALAGRIRGLEWRMAPFSLRGDRESVELDGLRLETGQAWLGAQGRVALSPTSPFDLQLEGSLDLGALHAALPEAGLDGDLELKLQVSGTRESPKLDGALRLSDARGRVAGVPWDDLDLVARFASGQVQVETLQASLLGGALHASGRFPLDRTAGEGALAFELRDLDLARLAPSNPSQATKPHSLVVSLDGEVRAAAAALDRIAGGGQLTRLEARSADGSLGLAAPAAWSLEAGRLELGAIRLAGPLGALEARVEALLAAPLGLSATVKGEADLSALDPFLDGVNLAGPARIDVRAGYEASQWRIEGGVVVAKARVSLEGPQFVATDLGGELRFDGERVRLEATAAVGDGTLRLHGGMRLGPALVGPVQLTLEADRVPIQHPPGFRGRATGALALTGDPGRYRLAGTVSLNQSYFTGEFDERAQALDRLTWQLAALDGGLLNQVALDVRLRLDEPLRIRNSRMQLDAEAAVQATGTLARPTASGRVTLREGGEVTLGRTRVRVTGGRIELNNHPAGTPAVDFQGHTRASGVAMDIRAHGALDDLQLTLSSDQAELTQADLVTLMLTGRTATAAASQGGTVVAEQLAMALGGVLQRRVGDSLLIDVSPERSLLSDDTDPTQRFNLGTRVTQNLTVIYSAALDGTEQRWIVELNPGGGRFRFRAITEEDNSFSLEASARLSFDLWNRGRRGAAPARERERLADLRFEGALPVPERELRRAARLRTGRRHSWLQREQAADRVRERLVQNGYRQASVDASSLPAPSGVELLLRVDAGPRVTLEWTGDDPGRRARQDGERAWLSFSTPDAAAAAVARAARWRLQSQRFYAARVEPQVSSGPGRLDVLLHVTRGAQGKGALLVFEGNTALADDALAAGLPSPGSPAFFEMLDARSARISSEVRMAYAGIGHLQAQVGKIDSAFDPASGRLRVTIAVSEGAPSTVLGIELPAEARDSDGPRLALAVGQPFDIAAYSADRETLAAWYRAQGFIDAEVRAALEPEKGGVQVRFLVDPGPRPRVGETRVAQTGRTSNSLIERSLTLREGDPVKPEALSESRERLWDLGLFRSVEVSAEPRPKDDAVRDIEVSLVDRPDVSVEYGLRYTTAGEGGAAGGPPSTPEGGQFQVAGAIELNNPLGNGVRARAYGSATLERQNWGLNLDAATLGGRRVRTQLFVFNDHDDHLSISGLTSHVRGVSLQQSRVLLRDRRSRRWHDRLRLQWGYVFKDVEYATSAEDTLLLQGDRGFLSLGAIGDERDSLTDPHRGIFWTANAELARTGLGSDVDYVRLFGQLFAYVPIGPLVWAQGYRFGSVPGEDPLLLIENRFHAGGPTTVRGYEQNGLGGITLEGNAIGGQAVAILNQELRFPIWKSLQGGVFWDAGNAWLTSGELDLGDLRQSVGGGLRYVFPFGPVRVEYAWILGRRPGEPRGRFVFGLGHAF